MTPLALVARRIGGLRVDTCTPNAEHGLYWFKEEYLRQEEVYIYHYGVCRDQILKGFAVGDFRGTSLLDVRATQPLTYVNRYAILTTGLATSTPCASAIIVWCL